MTMDSDGSEQDADKKYKKEMTIQVRLIHHAVIDHHHEPG
jgi:hypothetical protein